MATQIRIYDSQKANALQFRYLILVNNDQIMMCGKFDMWSAIMSIWRKRNAPINVKSAGGRGAEHGVGI